MFLGYGGDKGLIINGYVDPRFNTDPDDCESQSGYVLNVGTIS